MHARILITDSSEGLLEIAENLQNEVLDQDDKFKEWCRGEPTNPQKKKDKHRDKCLRNIVARYDSMDTMTYLKAIANLIPADLEFGPEFDIPHADDNSGDANAHDANAEDIIAPDANEQDTNAA